MDDLLDELRRCKHLFLETLTEPAVNQLRVVLAEGTLGAPVGADDLVSEAEPERSLLVGARPIVQSADSTRFELIWRSYIGYSVLNESYTADEASHAEVLQLGRRFIEYASSRYLEHLARASIATRECPGPFRHWRICCEGHTIDVASQGAPVIRRIAPR